MNLGHPVRQGVWLGLAMAAPDAVAAAQRLPRDRAAAARAEALARGALGLPSPRGSVSRAHTEGAGAALVASIATRLGTDLVRIDRVGTRHAESILSADEWEALAPYAEIRPALAWALKESAAKASGDPLRSFPGGVLIEAGLDGPLVRLVGDAKTRLVTGWLVVGTLLCGWVVPPTPLRTR